MAPVDADAARDRSGASAPVAGSPGAGAPGHPVAVPRTPPDPWRDLTTDAVSIAGRTLRIVHPRDSEALLDEEAFQREEFLPYWAQLWPSAIVLARATAALRPAGRSVLELGCGLGLPSITAALRGARVLATDWSPDAVAFAAANATRNGAALRTAVCSWTEPGALVAEAPWDLVLAADVLYEARNVDQLLELLPRLVDDSGMVLIADPGRRPAERFLRATAMPASGWIRRSAPDPSQPHVTLHHLRRSGDSPQRRPTGAPVTGSPDPG
jgi:predicted nicotinamide N-methyase